MLSKYMRKIVEKLTSVNFQFFNATQSDALENAIGAFWDALGEDDKEAAKIRMTMLAKLNYFKPNTDIVMGSGLYRCPNAEQVLLAGIFPAERVYDAYGTHDIEIEGKTVRLLNNYGDEDGVDERVGDNHAWFSPCIMYEESGGLVFELVDLVVPREEFGSHKPYVYRHAIAHANIPASFSDKVGAGKRAFFYGKNWLLRRDAKENVFSIRHSLEPESLQGLGIPVTEPTEHIKVGDFTLSVSGNMLVILANEIKGADINA